MSDGKSSILLHSRDSLQTAFRRWGVVAMALAILLFGISMLIPQTRDETAVLRLTAGSDSGLRHAIARKLADLAERKGIRITLEPTAGSAEALAELAAGQLELALVQGGLKMELQPSITQIAVLNVEPLHLLFKPHIDTSSGGPLHAIRGRTVNVGEPGSGTNLLTMELLRFAGLEPERDFSPASLSYAELLAKNAALDDLPDAVFTVSSLPSPVAEYLTDRYGYQLVEVPLAQAFKLAYGPDSDSAASQVVPHRIRDATIPAYTYRVDPPIPPHDIQTLGFRLQLLAHEGLREEDAERLTELIYDSTRANFTDPPITLEDLRSQRQVELHPGTRRYLDRKTPLVSEQVVAITEQLVAIVATTLGGLLFLWQWVRSSRQKVRSREFLQQVKRVVEIETRAMNYENDDAMTLSDLVRLQNELMTMKGAMVEDFQAGRIESTDLFSTFLNHVNDAAELITRLILHERAPRRL